MKNYIIALIVATCVTLVGWGAFELWDHRNGMCVIETSSVVVFCSRNVLGEPFLYYSGIYLNSGEKCLYTVRVTEAEYERQMYKLRDEK